MGLGQQAKRFRGAKRASLNRSSIRRMENETLISDDVWRRRSTYLWDARPSPPGFPLSGHSRSIDLHPAPPPNGINCCSKNPTSEASAVRAFGYQTRKKFVLSDIKPRCIRAFGYLCPRNFVLSSSKWREAGGLARCRRSAVHVDRHGLGKGTGALGDDHARRD